MEIQTLISRISFLLQKSLGIWLLVWAIRYKADWDFRLSRTAKAVRWGVVGGGYVLGASLPGPGVVRLVPGFVGICFLCWPNLAYHMTNLFVEWPTTEGRVGAVEQADSRSIITYSFELGGETFGGTTTLKQSGTDPYSEGQCVTVSYDPLNPDKSRVVARILNRAGQLE
jgi:Protein of unknown function (DUF3592)